MARVTEEIVGLSEVQRRTVARGIAETLGLTELLGIVPGRIAIKATTSERLGFVGREEGIVAMASASVEVPRID